jgi:hypothetical protein
MAKVSKLGIREKRGSLLGFGSIRNRVNGARIHLACIGIVCVHALSDIGRT